MKEIKEAIRNNKKVILIGTLVLLLVLLGTTFAYLTKTLNGNKEYIVRAGSLNLVLTEPNDLTFEKIIPIEDEEGLALNGFEFSVENKGTATTDYTVYLDDVELSNGETRMPDAYIRYSLDVDGVKGSPKDLQSMGSNPERVVTTGILKQNGKKNYVLRIWIEYNTTREQASGKTFKGKLRVVASPAPKPSVMKAFNFGDGTNYKNVVKVVTQNTLTEPSNVTYSEDLSEAGNGSFMAYVGSDNVLTIAGEDSIVAGEYIKFTNLSKVTSIDLTYLDTSNVTNMSQMFYNCSGLTSLDVSNFDTSKVTTMSSMFDSCYRLTSLDVSSFNTSNVTNMSSMFYGCSRLTSLDVSSFNTSNVTNMSGMFSFCSKLTSIDVSNFNTSNVTTMSSMFYGCSSLTSLDVSNFDTAKVTKMNSMFGSCNSLTSLDVSNFDTSKVTDMSGMFSFCSKLASLDVSNFNTAKVTIMYDMFSSCNSLTSLDLSSFNTSNVTNMNSMFSGCTKMQSIKVSSKWVIGSSCKISKMFDGCGVSSVTVV